MESDTLTLSDYLAVVRQRLPLVLGVAVITTVAALLISLNQHHLYRGQAEVALDNPPAFPGAAGSTSNNPLSDQRFAQTQALLAMTAPVAQRALAAAHVNDRTPQNLLDHSNVVANPNANLLSFQVDDPSKALAAQLATAYAREFTDYARSKTDALIEELRADLRSQVATSTRGLATASSRLVPVLRGRIRGATDKLNDLRTFQATYDRSFLLASSADTAKQIQPRTVRNVVLGAGIGLLLGLLLAFLYDSVDSRVRSARELTAGLPLAVLGRVPRPARSVRQRNQLVMIAQPDGPHAEAFRALRARVDYANGDRARSIMVTSAVEREGKSTTVANLAVAFAEAGRHVVLIDLDVARASVHRFFGLGRGPGVSDVVAGEQSLAAALATIDLPGSRPSSSNGGGRRNGRHGGSLRVLPVGEEPLDPIAVLTSPKLLEVLKKLRTESELVLIDAAPLLPVSDAVILSSNVDAVLAVAHAGMLRRSIVEELDVVLDSIPSTKLGVVLTGVPRGEAYGYPRYGAKPPARVELTPAATSAPSEAQKGR
jgi:succinoglycan biosynthesis transport protein ExoP